MSADHAIYDRLVTALHCLMDRPEFATLAACRVFAKNCANGFEQGSPALLPVGSDAHSLAVSVWCSNLPNRVGTGVPEDDGEPFDPAAFAEAVGARRHPGADPNCALCHGRGVVEERHPYGSTTASERLTCDCVKE